VYPKEVKESEVRLTPDGGLRVYNPQEASESDGSPQDCVFCVENAHIHCRWVQMCLATAAKQGSENDPCELSKNVAEDFTY
jgi:hypothetical protein